MPVGAGMRLAVQNGLLAVKMANEYNSFNSSETPAWVARLAEYVYVRIVHGTNGPHDTFV
jgi:hypothetical protein